MAAPLFSPPLSPVSVASDPLTVSLSSYILTLDALPSSTTVSGSVTATVSGGVPPYTYGWSDISTGGNTSTPVSPSALSSTFSVTVGAGDYETASNLFLVTDSLGQGQSATLSIIVYNQDGTGIPDP